MTTNQILDELQKLYKEWKDSEYQHYIVEGIDDKLKGFIRHPPANIKFDQHEINQFLMIASFQHGGNWFYWLERAKSLDNTISLLIRTLSISYKRVVYRILYALQIFDKEQIKSEINKKATTLPNDIIKIVQRFVYQKCVLDYLYELSKSEDYAIKSKSLSVISEIKKYSPYNFQRHKKLNQKIFISYNHKDSDFVKILIEKFHEEGIDLLVDINDLRFGDNIYQFIEHSTRITEFTLCIISKNSLRSPWVLLETIEALLHEKVKKKKKYLPIVIDNDVLDIEFYKEAKSSIEKGIHKLIEEIYQLSKDFVSTKSLENEKERLIELRNNFDKVIDKLKNHLYVDFSTKEKISENFPKLIAQIKENLGKE